MMFRGQKTFSDYFSFFENEFHNLFMEMAARKTSIPFDERDVELAKAVISALEKEAHANGATITDADKVDALDQAIRTRWSKNAMSGKIPDVAPLRIHLPNSNLARTEKFGGAERGTNLPSHWERVGVELPDMPIYGPELFARLSEPQGDGTWRVDPSQINLKVSGIQKAEQMLDHIQGNGPIPSYHPTGTSVIRDGDSEKPQDDESKFSRRRKESSGDFDVKSMERLGVDDNDRTYLDAVQSELKRLAKEGRQGVKLKGDGAEEYMAQAMAMRYSDCFVTKQGDKFVPKPGFESNGTVVLRKPGGKHPGADAFISAHKMQPSGSGVPGFIVLHNIPVNGAELAKRFQHARDNIGYDFVEKPLWNCKEGKPAYSNETRASSGMTTVRRWLGNFRHKKGGEALPSQGYQPMSGAAGQVFQRNDARLKEFEQAQQEFIAGRGESPNIPANPDAGTPRIPWHELVHVSVVKGWPLAMRRLREFQSGYMSQPGYEDFLKAERDNILSSVEPQVYMGMSGSEDYASEEARVNRAANAIAYYITKQLNPTWHQQSTDANIAGQDTSMGSSIAQTRELQPGHGEDVPTKDEPGSSDSPMPSTKDPEAYINWWFDPNNKNVMRRGDTVDYNEKWVTRDQMRSMLARKAPAAARQEEPEGPDDYRNYGRRFGRRV